MFANGTRIAIEEHRCENEQRVSRAGKLVDQSAPNCLETWESPTDSVMLRGSDAGNRTSVPEGALALSTVGPLLPLDVGGIVGNMPARRPADPTPDLFSATPTPKGSGSKTIPVPADLPSQPRHLLPKDLAGALERLDDTEIDSLLAAVTSEAERRGRIPMRSAKTTASDTKRPPVDAGAASLTTGKLNAVRAAFKAGVKPYAIARQFGISQSDVRKALATAGRDR